MKNWTTQIDIITAAYSDNFQTLSHEQLNWKPNPQTWSIAQIIEHVIMVNETYYPTIDGLKSGKYITPWIGKIGFITTFLGKTILNAVKPDRKRKMKTFPIWEPTESQINGDILAQFENHQTELKRYIETSNEFIDNRTIISSPANRNIVYKLETAFDIIVSHEHRHLEQAKEVLQLMNP